MTREEFIKSLPKEGKILIHFKKNPDNVTILSTRAEGVFCFPNYFLNGYVGLGHVKNEYKYVDKIEIE